MRQISILGTVALVGVGVGLWLPIRSLAGPALVEQAAAFPGLVILAVISDLLAQNPSVKFIVSFALVWAAIGLRVQTVASRK